MWTEGVLVKVRDDRPSLPIAQANKQAKQGKEVRRQA